MIYRLCTGGELFDKLGQQKAYTEKEAAGIMKQLLSAVVYCHSKKIVHRDLKPENLLMESATKNARLKVIDFGTSQLFDPNKKMTTKIGTPLYIAPEVLQKSYTEKCDIWSCGIILYVLLSGKHPFDAQNENELLQKIRKGVYYMAGPQWDEVSSQAKDLVKLMMLYDHTKRISAIEAINHPWILNCTDETQDVEYTKSLLNNVRGFSAEHKLQEAALTYIASQLTTSKEKEQLQAVFMELDKDKDGKLSKNELVQGFKKMFGEDYPAVEEVEKIMQKLDIDHNGFIDLTEFVMATMNKEKLLSNERLIAAFKMFDRVLIKLLLFRMEVEQFHLKKLKGF